MNLNLLPVPARSSSRYAGHYDRCDDAPRLLEILTESVDLALSSRVRATAQERFELAVELYHQLISLPLPDALRAEVEDATLALCARFPTQIRLNEAAGLCSKATKLKTPHRKIEYLVQARDLLASGVSEVVDGREELETALASVTHEIKRIRDTADGAPRSGTRVA